MSSASMEVDEDEMEVPSSSTSKSDRKRFEVKKVILIFKEPDVRI